MNLREIEKQLKAQLKEKQKELLRAKKASDEVDRVAQPVSVERVVSKSDEFSLQPVFRYLDALRRMPRAVLLARYHHDVGEAPPNMPRRWLVEKMARKLQDELYLKHRGEIPARVKWNNYLFGLNSVYSVPDGYVDPDEPVENLHYDPSLRAQAAADNPFSRGRAWTMFEVIRLAASKGVSFKELVFKLQRVLEIAEKRAEKRAQQIFTQWVTKGWVKVIAEEGRS